MNPTPSPAQAPPSPGRADDMAHIVALVTVRGAFRTTAGLDRALARLAAARPPAIVGVVAADAAAERWLAGSSSGAARTLLVVLAGAVEDVALGYRQAWQAIELSGGVPSAGGRLREGVLDGGSMYGGDARDALHVRVELPEDDLTALLDWAADLRALAGGAGAFVLPGTGCGWVVVPPGARAEESLAWLGAKVRGRRGRLAVAAAAAIAS